MKSDTCRYQKQEKTRKKGEVANRRLQKTSESASGEVEKFAEKRIGAERVLPEDRDLRLWQVSEIFYLREVECVTGEEAPRRGYRGIAKLSGVGCDYVCCEFQAVISRV